MGYTENFPITSFFSKLKLIPSSQVKHIIERGRCILRKFEIFSGVFASVADTKEGDVLSVVGRPRACLLAEFIVDMILEANTLLWSPWLRMSFSGPILPISFL